MLCPLCSSRKSRRACPALGRQICAVCCGEKREREIACPRDCVYLLTAREHPPAAARRQQERDQDLLLYVLRDFDEQQQALLALILSWLGRYEPPELSPLADADLGEALGALAGTFETAARGVIYEHRPASVPAARLAAALKAVLTEAGQGGGTAFERDAAVVLRRMEEAVRRARVTGADDSRAFLRLVERVKSRLDSSDAAAAPRAAARLIVP